MSAARIKGCVTTPKHAAHAVPPELTTALQANGRQPELPRDTSYSLSGTSAPPSQGLSAEMGCGWVLGKGAAGH